MKTSLLSVLFFTLCASPVFAANWPNWRGPNGDGTAEGKGYATEWSTTKNIKWKFKLPGRGASTPAVWGDAIFVTCYVDGKNLLICLGRDGKERWRKELGKGVRGKNRKASGANPSPITDGKLVYVYFKSGELACLDFTGSIKWQLNLQDKYGKDTLWWDLGTSPVLTKKDVVIAVMQSNNSFLVALDRESGKVSWKQDRNLGAPVEAEHSYSTPIVTTRDGKEQLLVLGADHVTAHDAGTGKEIWRIGGLNPRGEKYFRSIASPLLVGDLLVAPYSRGATLRGIKLGGKGDVTDSHVAWMKNLTRKDPRDDVPTPAAGNGRFYVAGDRGKAACYDVKTGNAIWQVQVGARRFPVSASPTVAEGKIYITSERGTTAVLDAKNGKTLAVNELKEDTVASPVLVDGLILQRTHEHLWCIGK